MGQIYGICFFLASFNVFFLQKKLLDTQGGNKAQKAVNWQYKTLGQIQKALHPTVLIWGTTTFMEPCVQRAYGSLRLARTIPVFIF